VNQKQTTRLLRNWSVSLV